MKGFGLVRLRWGLIEIGQSAEQLEAVTMMTCPDMSIESPFLEALEMADNYSLNDDGMLSLNRARMAPLARFEVAESK